MSAEDKKLAKLAEDKVLAEEVSRLNQLDAPPPVTERHGFLPIDANLFDRCFISVVCLVAIHLLWLRFVESILPIGFATGISLVLAFAIIRWG